MIDSVEKLTLDLIRVTEAAAISAAKYVGSGDKVGADKVATEAMSNRLNKIEFRGVIAIGEGKKDQSYGLFENEQIGNKTYWSPKYELAVDPIDGTTPTVNAGPEAMSVLAVTKIGSFARTDKFYMLKLVGGPKLVGKLDLFKEIKYNIYVAKKELNKNSLCVCVLNRPRHEPIINELRKMNVRIKLINDCDISGAIATCLPDSDVDLYYGIGGSPEGIITAAAIKSYGGFMEARIVEDDKFNTVKDAKYGDILRLKQLVKDDCAFIATGITDGTLLKGVKFVYDKAITNSLFMRSESHTVRWIKTYHGN